MAVAAEEGTGIGGDGDYGAAAMVGEGASEA